jgi:ribonucleotide reductase alpha subunit
LGEQHGYRNAQVSVIAPTGTIGLVMDCDTTGIEPDFALVKFKTLAGGGYFKIINQTVPLALANLGYDQAAAQRIVAHAVGHGTLKGAPAINHETLAARGFDAATLDRVEKALPTAFDIRFAFSRYTWATTSAARCWRSRMQRSPIRSSTCWHGSASRAPTSPRRTSMPAGPCRSRARPISSASISRSSIVQIPVDEMARAACLRRVTSA